jgi:hypothetical protein
MMKTQDLARVLTQGPHLGPTRRHRYALTHGLPQPLLLGVTNLNKQTHGVISQTHVLPRSLLQDQRHDQPHLPSPGGRTQRRKRIHGVLNQLRRLPRPAETSPTMPLARGVIDRMRPAAQSMLYAQQESLLQY